MSFRDRIASYNASKEPKINPPEATQTVEQLTLPEVENVAVAAASSPEQVDTNSVVQELSPEFNPLFAQNKETKLDGRTKAARARRTATSGAEKSAEASAHSLTTEELPLEALLAELTRRGYRWAVSS